MLGSYNNIIGIHAVPRSGTSWLAQIFNASPDVALKFQPLFSYAFKDYLSLTSTAEDINRFFDEIYRSDDYFINMRDKDIHKNYPVFEKHEKLTHLVFKHVRYHYLIEQILENHPTVKFILLIRNPLSVLASWYRAPREFYPEWNLQSEWRYAEKKNQGRKEEYFGFEKWKETAYLFLRLKKQYPHRIYLLQYIDLLNNTAQEVKKMFDFSELTFHSQVSDFILNSKRRADKDPNSVFKQKSSFDDDWKTVLPENIIFDVKDDLKGTDLEQFFN